MQDQAVTPFMRVLYTREYDKFGLTNRDCGKQFVVTGRSFDHGAQEYMYDLTDEWGGGRLNVSARHLEPVEEN